MKNIILSLFVIAVINSNYNHSIQMLQVIDKPDAIALLVSDGQNGLYQGIHYAIEGKVDVICIPMATPFYNADVADAVQKAIDSDIKVVAGTWNKDLHYELRKMLGVDMTLAYPACYPGVIQAGKGESSFAAAKLACKLDKGE